MTTPEYDEFRTFLHDGAYQEATRCAEHMLLHSSETSAFWWTQLALSKTGERKCAEAIAAADRALELQPGNGFALVARAEALKKVQKFEEALQTFEEASADERVRKHTQWGILDCLNRLGQWQRVLSLLAEWQVPERRARPWRAAALAGLERTEEAISECRAWLRQSPDHTRALWLLTDLEIKEEGLDSVLQRVGRLARIPSRPSIYGEIYASLCRRAGKTGAASEQYEKLSEASSDLRLRRKQAFLHAKTGREQEAIPTMEELLRASPTDVYVHQAYIAACRRSNELPRADAFYTELLQTHSEEKSLHGRQRTVRRLMETQP